MELRIPSRELVRMAYRRDLKAAFPEEELKSLRNIEQTWRNGWYRPYCLFEDGEIVGECFLWMRHPGWGLLDYLCVPGEARNRGLGAVMLRMLREAEPDSVIFGEAEDPPDAPDPAMAERRLGFYARCGLRTAGYDTEIFGVHYKTLYLAEKEVEDQALMREHRYAYESIFSPKQYEKYIRIPYDPSMGRGIRVPWQQGEKEE